MAVSVAGNSARSASATEGAVRIERDSLGAPRGDYDQLPVALESSVSPREMQSLSTTIETTREKDVIG